MTSKNNQPKYQVNKILLCGLLLALVGNANSVSGDVKLNYISDEIFLCFTKNTTDSGKNIIINDFGLKKIRDYKLIRASLYKVRSDASLIKIKYELNKLSEVEYVEFNYIHNLQQFKPNDPEYNNQWYLNNTGQSVNGVKGSIDSDIQWPEAMDKFSSTVSILVAVIDSGLAYDHPDINSKIVAGGWNFIDNNNDIMDLNGHGTMVSSVISGVTNNNLGICGVAPNVKILPIKVFDEFGGGATDDNIILGIAYAVDMGAKIINLSLGMERPFSFPLQDALTTLENEYDVLLICAAGNGSVDRIGDNIDQDKFYPASYSGNAIVSVAATDQENNLLRFSNYGVNNVDIAAPGSNIIAADVSRKNFIIQNFEGDITGWKTFLNLATFLLIVGVYLWILRETHG